MEKVLIAGIKGFLGRRLATILNDHYIIFGLDRDNSIINLAHKNKEIIIYESTEDSIEQAFFEHKFDFVINAATVYKVEGSIIPIIQSNVILPVYLYELSEKYNAKLFINSDTFFNTGLRNYDYLSEYTYSKEDCINWLNIVKGNCKIANMKIFHMFGPNDNPNKFIQNILIRLLNNERFINLTPGNQKRDFIFVDDVVNAYRVLLEKNEVIHDKFSQFEVGTGVDTSLKKALGLALRLINSKSELRFGALDYRDGEIMKSKANIGSLVQLGWLPNYTLADGLKITIDSLKS
jgi:nucleoside-diphosphate-sugar epimerase